VVDKGVRLFLFLMKNGFHGAVREDINLPNRWEWIGKPFSYVDTYYTKFRDTSEFLKRTTFIPLLQTLLGPLALV